MFLLTRLARVAILVIFSTAFSHSLVAQSLDLLNDERTKQLQELGVLLPNPQEIRATAAEEFAKPKLEQDAGVLEKLANAANSYSNLVHKITDEYNDYLRENSRYDFVTEDVRKASVVTSLLELDSEFKGIRNRAYVNLGIIAKEEGREMEAFLFFNDAFRLSVFDCAHGAENCTRYEAEQHMKSMLGVEGDSYIYWQK